MDWAYADKLAEDNNGVKYLLFRQNLFDRTVDAKGMKTKGSKKRVLAVLTRITKKNQPKKIWVDKGTEFSEEFEKLCRAEGMRTNPTMSDTKAAIAERSMRSLRNKLYFNIDDYGYEYIHKI